MVVVVLGALSIFGVIEFWELRCWRWFCGRCVGLRNPRFEMRIGCVIEM